MLTNNYAFLLNALLSFKIVNTLRVKARYTLPVSTVCVYGPCPRPVNTGIQNDARIHGPCWSPVYPTRPVNTGDILDTLTPGFTSVDTARKHKPWTRVVCTEL